MAKCSGMHCSASLQGLGGQWELKFILFKICFWNQPDSASECAVSAVGIILCHRSIVHAYGCRTGSVLSVQLLMSSVWRTLHMLVPQQISKEVKLICFRLYLNNLCYLDNWTLYVDRILWCCHNLQQFTGAAVTNCWSAVVDI